MFKHLFDIAEAVGGVIVLVPVPVVVGAAIRLEDGRPVFFAQSRPGAQPEGFTGTQHDDDVNRRIDIYFSVRQRQRGARRLIPRVAPLSDSDGRPCVPVRRSL